MDKNNGIGKTIRTLRKLRYMTQADLAKASGMERTSIVNIEGGKQTLTVQTINAIADALGYEVQVQFRLKRSNVGSEGAARLLAHIPSTDGLGDDDAK